jgi:hypothetical protein
VPRELASPAAGCSHGGSSCCSAPDAGRGVDGGGRSSGIRRRRAELRDPPARHSAATDQLGIRWRRRRALFHAPLLRLLITPDSRPPVGGHLQAARCGPFLHESRGGQRRHGSRERGEATSVRAPGEPGSCAGGGVLRAAGVAGRGGAYGPPVLRDAGVLRSGGA